MIELNWSDYYHYPVDVEPFPDESIRLRALRIIPTETLDFGAPMGQIEAREVMRAARSYDHISRGTCRPQLAALLFDAARKPRALNTYFPLTHTLDAEGQKTFYKMAGAIAKKPTFDVRLYNEKQENMISVVPGVAFFVACQLAEIFYYRRKLVDRFLDSPRSFWFYTTPEAFKAAGGAAGGNYSHEIGGIQLVLARLYEGFYEPTPGVSPFLHEFGHMLDHFDVTTGQMGKSQGTLPGMRPDDGDFYRTDARERFLKGKAVEMERYQKLHEKGYEPDDLLPIGHPYVFQNNTEFVAGYFEMFFRNPHYFGAQNPDLYQGFVLAFGQDPRDAWIADFPFYINSNQDFYKSGQRPHTSGLTLP
jgi:hypothetical protein